MQLLLILLWCKALASDSGIRSLLSSECESARSYSSTDDVQESNVHKRCEHVVSMDAESLAAYQESSIDEPSPGHSSIRDTPTKSPFPVWYQRTYFEKLKSILAENDAIKAISDTVMIEQLDYATDRILSGESVHPMWSWMFVGAVQIKESGFVDDSELWFVAGMKYFVQDIKGTVRDLKGIHITQQKKLFAMLEGYLGTGLDHCIELSAELAEKGEEIMLFNEMINGYRRIKKVPFYFEIVQTFVPEKYWIN